MKRFVISLFLSVCGFAALAQNNNPYGWTAATNEALYGNMLTYMRTLQADLLGEPLYYMTQNLMVELEAVHEKDAFAWMGQVHRFLNFAENIYPPMLGNPMTSVQDKYDKIRRDLMMLRDYPMHQVSLYSDTVAPVAGQFEAFKTANSQWLQNKRDEFFRNLSLPRPTGGELQVFKLYSSGFVFRTKNACIGMDICYEEGLYSSDRVNELADMLDVLYVTHAHGDHYDMNLMRRMLLLGKPVVMTKDLVAGSYPGQKCIWSAGQDTPVTLGPTKSQGFMSAQGDEPCLLYLVEIDGWRIIHVGDNSVHANEVAYSRSQIADVVVAPVFQGLVSLFNSTRVAANPNKVEQIYINCHENEFHHTIVGRVSYRYMYTNSAALGNASTVYPSYAVLDCGEMIVLNK